MNQSTVNLDLALQAAMQRCMDPIVREANADLAYSKRHDRITILQRGSYVR